MVGGLCSLRGGSNRARQMLQRNGWRAFGQNGGTLDRFTQFANIASTTVEPWSRGRFW
jgi:hypothetical protein